MERDVHNWATDCAEIVAQLTGRGTNSDRLDQPAVQVFDEERHAPLAAHAQMRIVADERNP
jgi:hypothetical protein